MVELNTREQALAYLAQMSPSSTFAVYPFEMGWVCQTILTQEERAAGKGLGLANLVIDSQTGVVTVHSSLPTDMVATMYTEAKKAGRPTGNQIYPHQWRITIQRLREDPEIIEYQMTAVSLKNPPEPTQEHPLTINKQTYQSEPADQLSTLGITRAVALSQQNQGVWPEHATLER